MKHLFTVLLLSLSLLSLNAQGKHTYGPVSATDTLWHIAQRVRPNTSVPVAVMMKQLVHANPQAFRHGDPGQLLAGSVLTIPTLPHNKAYTQHEIARLQHAIGQARRALKATQAEDRALVQHITEVDEEIIQLMRRLAKSPHDNTAPAV